MRLQAFDYELPATLIAQEPAAERDRARLLVVARGGRAGGADRRATGSDADLILEETTVGRLPELLRRGDLVVLNDTRVRPVRLHARKPTGGAVELLLLREEGAPHDWECLLSTSKGLVAGTRLSLGDDATAELLTPPSAGRASVRLHTAPGGSESTGDADLLERHGVMPLPPYIKREPGDARARLDRERYQTVYARHEGAVAAPTAGLHLTTGIMEELPRRGIALATLTLHVGPGTFLPVRTETIEEHTVEPERFALPAATAESIAACRRGGGRVVAVGTTVTRVLEARAAEDGTVAPGEGWCDLYLRPGHRFRVVDALLTNLHLPRSSLLILVAAFAGRERILAAYREAVRRGLRFYSYGDAMLLL